LASDWVAIKVTVNTCMNYSHMAQPNKPVNTPDYLSQPAAYSLI
jgi:hypothetical protein